MGALVNQRETRAACAKEETEMGREEKGEQKVEEKELCCSQAYDLDHTVFISGYLRKIEIIINTSHGCWWSKKK